VSNGGLWSVIRTSCGNLSDSGETDFLCLYVQMLHLGVSATRVAVGSGLGGWFGRHMRNSEWSPPAGSTKTILQCIYKRRYLQNFGINEQSLESSNNFYVDDKCSLLSDGKGSILETWGRANNMKRIKERYYFSHSRPFLAFWRLQLALHVAKRFPLWLFFLDSFCCKKEPLLVATTMNNRRNG
jgi:hypothetical protein